MNTMLSLSKLLATVTFLSRLSYWDIFSTKVLLSCHVPGCHESALLDTVSRSRCEPHASNPKLRFAYCTPNHLTLNNWSQVSHSTQWCLISKRVSHFTRKQTCSHFTLVPSCVSVMCHTLILIQNHLRYSCILHALTKSLWLCVCVVIWKLLVKR